jgi:hypothetical protein
MKKWTIILAVSLGALGTVGLAKRAEALPTFEKITYYYSDATYTTEVGWRQNLSCQYPWGQGPLHGTATVYRIVETEPCN